jgi:hypothetical protein
VPPPPQNQEKRLQADFAYGIVVYPVERSRDLPGKLLFEDPMKRRSVSAMQLYL